MSRTPSRARSSARRPTCRQSSSSPASSTRAATCLASASACSRVSTGSGRSPARTWTRSASLSRSVISRKCRAMPWSRRACTGSCCADSRPSVTIARSPCSSCSPSCARRSTDRAGSGWWPSAACPSRRWRSASSAPRRSSAASPRMCVPAPRTDWSACGTPPRARPSSRPCSPAACPTRPTPGSASPASSIATPRPGPRCTPTPASPTTAASSPTTCSTVA